MTSKTIYINGKWYTVIAGAQFSNHRYTRHIWVSNKSPFIGPVDANSDLAYFRYRR